MVCLNVQDSHRSYNAYYKSKILVKDNNTINSPKTGIIISLPPTIIRFHSNRGRRYS